MENSPLNRLPPELRQEIFEYVFTYESLTCKGKKWRTLHEDERYYRPLSKDLDITLVCKQIREETRRLPFSLNKLLCGNELGDLDPWCDWHDALPLKEPCAWAYNALRGLTHVLSDSTTLELHLWAFPAMSEPRKMGNTDWVALNNAFGALVGVLGPAKLVVTLHFALHFKDLRCDYLDPLVWHGETRFEIHAGRFTAANEGMSLLAATMDQKCEEIKCHEGHLRDGYCAINQYSNTLSRQLMETEQVCRRFMSLAMHASTPGDDSFDMSEIEDCLPSGQQQLRRDSARPIKEEGH
jgi:hypothetical protein